MLVGAGAYLFPIGNPLLVTYLQGQPASIPEGALRVSPGFLTVPCDQGGAQLPTPTPELYGLLLEP